MNVPLDIFNFDRYDYEVAFEYRDSGFLRRLLTRKKDYLAYYIRRANKESQKRSEEELLSRMRDLNERIDYSFRARDHGNWKAVYWDNSGEPQDLLMRVYMKLKPSQDNVTFSTASLIPSP